MRRHPPLHRLVGPALAGLVMLVGAGPVAAQVLQIGDDGTTTTFAGPAVITAAGTEQIAAETRAVTAAAPTAPSLAPAAVAVAATIRSAAAIYGLDPALIRAVAWHESRYRQSAVSARGAIGIMQLMPETARFLGVDPRDPVQNIRGGAALLARLGAAYAGDLRLTLAAYSAGMGAVRRFGGVPPFAETQNYVSAILRSLGTPETLR